MKNRFIFILAVLFALAAAFGTFKYMDNLKKTYQVSGNFAQIAVARQKIMARTLISEDMLDFKEMPAEYVLPGSIVDVKDAAGKLAKGDIYPGEPILSGKLVARDDPAAGLSSKVKPGKRAVTIPVNNVTALHGLINIGDSVDVMVTFNTQGEQKAAATSTIIQNVPVLAVNKSLDSVGASKEELQTLTLMVQPEEAQQVALALQQGSVQLMLRSPEDAGAVPLPTIKLERLIR
jgi:pilus assembly protein CpaB